MTRFFAPLLLAISLVMLTSSIAYARQSNTAASPQVVLRGRAVCLDNTDGAIKAGRGCSPGQELFGFSSAEGKLYTFLSTDTAPAMFKDERVRNEELRLQAVLHSKDQLEIVRINTVKNGKLFDVYYFCHVCNITAYAPGPCPCCYEEFQLIETPAEVEH